MATLGCTPPWLSIHPEILASLTLMPVKVTSTMPPIMEAVGAILCFVQGADVGVNSSLALDATGNPRIAYFDDTHDDLKYAWWDGSTWQDQVVDFVGEVGLHPSLTLDSAGNPRITYYDITNQHLKYAFWTGATWSATTIDANTKVGLYSSIDIDSNGNTHIAYYDEQNGNLKYMYWSGSAWVTPSPR